MNHISLKPSRSTVNYHVMFLQNPIPQAILAADGQFIDANSQFCRYFWNSKISPSLTQKTIQQLREMTLFKFAHPDDLPCAFGWIPEIGLILDHIRICCEEAYERMVCVCFVTAIWVTVFSPFFSRYHWSATRRGFPRTSSVTFYPCWPAHVRIRVGIRGTEGE